MTLADAAADIWEATERTVRADRNLAHMVDMMPVPDAGKDAIWSVLAVAYQTGRLAGVQEAQEIFK